MTLEGIGENLSLRFEKLIKSYKEKIKNENIDYLTLAYQIQPNIILKTITKSKKLKGIKNRNELLKSQLSSDEENLKIGNKTKYKKKFNKYSNIFFSMDKCNLCIYFIFSK
jgi:glucose-6-phosphate isomerase